MGPQNLKFRILNSFLLKVTDMKFHQDWLSPSKVIQGKRSDGRRTDGRTDGRRTDGRTDALHHPYTGGCGIFSYQNLYLPTRFASSLRSLAPLAVGLMFANTVEAA